MARRDIGEIETIGRGAARCEGVVIDRDGNAWGGGRDGRLYCVAPDGTTRVHAELPAGCIPNGITMDRNGDLLWCDLGKRAVMRLDAGGKLTRVADEIAGVKLSMPNFLCFDAEGNLYVSNSSTATVAEFRPELHAPQPRGALLRLRPDGRGEVLASDLYVANGLAISPDESAIFVLQTTAYNCLRIPLAGGAPELYACGFPAIPDGMAFDAAGDLYVTLPGRPKRPDHPPLDRTMASANIILRVDPAGYWSELVADPAGAKLHHPTNCAFGGADLRDLWFANLEADHFSRLRMATPGHKLYHQR